MWPESYAEAPLKGLRMVEVFSGVPEEGGAMLSAAWEAAGGIAPEVTGSFYLECICS